MVQEIKTYLFQCEVCGKVHQSSRRHAAEVAALQCEKSGIALPEFKTFDVVYAHNGKGQTLRGIVLRIIHWDNSHLLPKIYIVSFGRHNMREVLRENMKAANVPARKGDKLACPICNSGKVLEANFEDYHPYSNAGHVGLTAYPRMHPLVIHGVAISWCRDCSSSFFTSEQSRLVSREIKNIFKGISMPIANRAELIRHNRFAH